MKNRFWGTDILLFTLVLVTAAFAAVIAITRPDLVVVCILGVCVSSVAVLFNAHAVRKIIRGVFFGYGKQSARQQLSFENLFVPVAIINRNSIVWYNTAFRSRILEDNDCYLTPLEKIVPGFKISRGACKSGANLVINSREYTVFSAAASDDDSLWVCYFMDDTDLKWEAREYHMTRPVVMQIVVDTYDEVLKEMKESKRAQIMAALDRLVEQTAGAAKGISVKVSSSRYHIVMEERYFSRIYESQFEMLSKARLVEEDSVTLSVGVGRGGKDFSENDDLARQALDMALGRGGDQAVVKSLDGYEFFGGTLPSVEKRSKVRSRIVAKALKDVILQSENVLIMGHKMSDLDAIGSAVGVAAAVESCGRKPHIVVNEELTLAKELIDHVKRRWTGGELFISAEKAGHFTGSKTLLIIVDTHVARMTESMELCSKCGKKVVIDHHRRMVDYITDTVVSYHEPYASSASELVTELLQYIIPTHYKITRVQAQALLAGIMLDTRNFAEKAGVRTFEAAAYLRRQGAMPNDVLKFFSVTKEVYQAKSELVNKAVIYKDVAIALSEALPRELSVAVPQAANDLLSINEVAASVVAVKFDEQINISARSLGEVNVQVLMEYLGGGGHLTMAGAQLKGISLEQAEEKIKESIDNYRK